MEPAHWRAVEALFHRVVDLPSEDRGSIYEEEAVDPELREEVERLVAADPPADDRWADVVGRELDQAPRLEPFADPKGRVMGAYELLHELGRGGQGVVYLARRTGEGLEGEVALKVLHAGIGEASIHRRFREERRILSGLEHPNIARFLDAGNTPDGRPFFAMEAVRGQPIDAYCESHSLGTKERLELFCRAAKAVQAAHRQLVIHRDIKASNLLVTPAGEPKLLDFGIARLLEGAGPVTVTRHLTPEAASPEQIRGERLTTATDIYSLGLLLYRLITGRAAYELRGKSPAALERTICLAEPAPPSSLPGKRHARGDLDAIVLQALRKEPEERYPSVEQLVEDLHRFMRHEPVRARRAGWGYRAGKFLRRHGRALSTALFVLLLLGAVSVAFTLELRRERDRALVVENVLLEIFETADPIRSDGQELLQGLRSLLEQTHRSLPTLDAQPEVQARLLHLLGSIHRTLGEHDRGRELLTEALRLRREGSADAVEISRNLYQLGVVDLEQGLFPRARIRLAEALALAAERPEARWHEANCRLRLAEVAFETGDYGLASEGAHGAMRLRRELLGDRSPDTHQALDLAGNLDLLAGLRYVQEDVAGAVVLWRQALELLLAAVGPEHLAVAGLWNNLGMGLRKQGRLEEALGALRRAEEIDRTILGDASLRRGIRLLNLGNLYRKIGRPHEAIEACTLALGMTLELRGEDHPNVPRIRACLATAEAAAAGGPEG